jgi:hypothetical protein
MSSPPPTPRRSRPETLQRIARLYAIEKDIRGRSPDERRAARQERSRPILAELEPWLREKLDLISQKSSKHPNSAIDDLLPWTHVGPQPLKAVA